MMESRIKDKSKYFLYFAIAIAAFSAFLIYYTFTHEGTAYSPDNAYKASYNRLKRTLALKSNIDGAECYIPVGERPSLLWSPDSKFLVISYHRSDGYKSDLLSLTNFSGRAIPDKASIQSICPEARAIDNGNNDACIVITKWLDDDHVIIEFSWPDNGNDSRISGWLIYKLSSGQIKEVTVNRNDVSAFRG